MRSENRLPQRGFACCEGAHEDARMSMAQHGGQSLLLMAQHGGKSLLLNGNGETGTLAMT